MKNYIKYYFFFVSVLFTSAVWAQDVTPALPKQYDKAKGLYVQAQNILPAESYPNMRIAAINKKMDSGGDETDMSAVYEKCKTSVFYVIEFGVTYWDEVKMKSQGSGFFISSSGIGISNYHVLNKSNYQNSRVVLDKDNFLKYQKF